MATNITTAEHIARLALSIIKESCAVNSVEVPRTTPEEIVNLHYAQARRRVLAKLRPYCAATRAEVSKDTEYPSFGSQVAYRLPNDFLALRFVFDESLPLAEIPYTLEGFHILYDGDNGPSLPVGYIRDMDDVARLPSHVAEVIAHELALKLALSIAGKPAMQMTVSTLLQRAWLEAGALEAQQNPTKVFASSRVLNARQYYGSGVRAYPRNAARTA